MSTRRTKCTMKRYSKNEMMFEEHGRDNKQKRDNQITKFIVKESQLAW